MQYNHHPIAKARVHVEPAVDRVGNTDIAKEFGLARLIENYEEVGAAISEAASVLNRPLEYGALSRGLRPQLSGAIAFDDVSFTYGSTEIPALERVTFAVPAGTMSPFTSFPQ